MGSSAVKGLLGATGCNASRVSWPVGEAEDVLTVETAVGCSGRTGVHPASATVFH